MRTAPAHTWALLRRSGPWLMVAVVALAGAVAIGAIITSDPAGGTVSHGDVVADESRAPDDSAQATTSSPAGSRRTSTPDVDKPEQSTADDVGASPRGWLDVARGFGQTFTQTALGQEAWFSAMSSWLTEEQAAMYRDVPIEQIPTGTLQDVDIEDPGDGPATRGLLTYDTGMVLEVKLSYVDSAGSWLVASVTLATNG